MAAEGRLRAVAATAALLTFRHFERSVMGRKSTPLVGHCIHLICGPKRARIDCCTEDRTTCKV